MDATDSISWPTRDRSWPGKVMLMSLVSIVPVAGSMALLGWMMACLDNLRAGRDELPPAGFGHLRRGARLFVVLLVYALAIGGLLVGCLAAGAALTSAAGRNGSLTLALLGTLVLLFGMGAGVIASLGLYLFLPGIVLATERGGIVGGLSVGNLVRQARRRPGEWAAAGVMTIVAHLVGGLGSLLCGVGIFLTLAYGYAMLAAITHGFETGAPGGPAATI